MEDTTADPPTDLRPDMLTLTTCQETFWATPLGGSRYAVESILLCGRCSLGDVVEADDEGEVTSVLTRQNVSHAFSCASTRAVERLTDLLESLLVPNDHMYQGLVLAAFPTSDGDDSASKPSAERRNLQESFLDEHGSAGRRHGWLYLGPVLMPEDDPAQDVESLEWSNGQFEYRMASAGVGIELIRQQLSAETWR